MPPQLVIADAPYKLYPGGVIVLRCADWLGTSGATTEADARSCCGTVVRETQQVATFGSISATPFQAAADTLTIDTTQLPLEISDVAYVVLLSYLLEGDWDPTNPNTVKAANQEYFNLAVQAGMYGDSTNNLSSKAVITPNLARKTNTYRIASLRIPVQGFGSNEFFWSSAGDFGDLHFRAYSQSGTTIEWLLDQIYFLPVGLFSGGAHNWKLSDFNAFAVQRTIGDVYNLDPADPGTDWVDGADGGDAYGKFTWAPTFRFAPTDIFGFDGGGDYQQDDSEYFARVVSQQASTGFSDFLELTNSKLPSQHDPASHAYSVNGPHYVPAQTWLAEDWDRYDGGDHDYQDPAVGDGHFEDHEWGTGPDGFYWTPTGVFGPDFDSFNGHNHGNALYCDASGHGVMASKVGDSPTNINLTAELRADQNTGAGIAANSYKIYGSFRVEDIDIGQPDTPPFIAQPFIISTRSGPTYDDGRNFHRIAFDLRTMSHWQLWYFHNTFGSLDDPVGSPPIFDSDISGWAAYGVDIAFRIEITRFLLRIKVWEKSAGEPGAWDYEDFREMRGPFDAYQTYDYSDNLGISSDQGFIEQGLKFELGGATHRSAGAFAVFFNDDLEISYDPLGDNLSSFASMEDPDGTEVGRIETPAGAQQLIYWGTRAWSKWNSDDSLNYVDFSSKVWNADGAASLQLSRCLWWWFRSVHLDLIPMNWRSSDRQGNAWRVLVGQK